MMDLKAPVSLNILGVCQIVAGRYLATDIATLKSFLIAKGGKALTAAAKGCISCCKLRHSLTAELPLISCKVWQKSSAPTLVVKFPSGKRQPQVS